MLQLQLTSRDERKTVDELLITRKEAGPWKEKLLISGIKLFDDDFVERESTRERVERMVADISLSLSKDRAAAATTNRTLLRIISWSKPEEGWVKWSIRVRHIPREISAVADGLAAISRDALVAVLEFQSAPSELAEPLSSL
ncbi:hypothetical protein V6N11_059356 [Hibiscus sabdariffa]|uniref:Uncharacterized protein n=1 Tax=Hibiscus sabdariffa TaxID=183260 RepID=A0ABR2AE35_9ROSI